MYDYFIVGYDNDKKKFKTFADAMHYFMEECRRCTGVEFVCLEICGVSIIDGTPNYWVLFNHDGFNLYQAGFFAEYFTDVKNRFNV